LEFVFSVYTTAFLSFLEWQKYKLRSLSVFK
jgi:hypothetical protein